jgi:C-terminal processing protease CtpA/Prc
MQSVPYGGMVTEDIGYVKFISFTQNSAEDVYNEFEALKKKGNEKIHFGFARKRRRIIN